MYIQCTFNVHEMYIKNARHRETETAAIEMDKWKEGKTRVGGDFVLAFIVVKLPNKKTTELKIPPSQPILFHLTDSKKPRFLSVMLLCVDQSNVRNRPHFSSHRSLLVSKQNSIG